MFEIWPLLYITQHLQPPSRKCTVSGCCLVIRRRNREAFQIMTVLVLKRLECLEHNQACYGSEFKYKYKYKYTWKYKFMTVLVLKRSECLTHEKTRLWRSGVTRATLTSHYQTPAAAALYRFVLYKSILYHIPSSPSGQFTGWYPSLGTILIHLDPITPSVLGPFDVA